MVEFGYGFRFCPTDEELVVHYLRNWLMGTALPYDGVVVERDLYGCHPRELFQAADSTVKSLYFFTRLRKKNPNAKRFERTVYGGGIKVGTWEGLDSSTTIMSSNNNNNIIISIGSYKNLVFKAAAAIDDGEDQWRFLMKEYTLDPTSFSLPPTQVYNDVVLCKIKRKMDPKKCDTKRRKITMTTTEENHNGQDQLPLLLQQQQPPITAFDGQYFIDQFSSMPFFNLSAATPLHQLPSSSSSTTTLIPPIDQPHFPPPQQQQQMQEEEEEWINSVITTPPQEPQQVVLDHLPLAHHPQLSYPTSAAAAAAATHDDQTQEDINNGMFATTTSMVGIDSLFPPIDQPHFPQQQQQQQVQEEEEDWINSVITTPPQEPQQVVLDDQTLEDITTATATATAATHDDQTLQDITTSLVGMTDSQFTNEEEEDFDRLLDEHFQQFAFR